MEKDKETLQLLGNCPSERVEEFLHRIIDSICGQRTPLYYDFCDVWSLTEWWEVSEAWKKFICKVIHTNSKEKIRVSFYSYIYHSPLNTVIRDEIEEFFDILKTAIETNGSERIVLVGDLNSRISAMLSQLPQSYRQQVATCLSVRNCDIKDTLVEKTCAISGISLKDFDWKLKLVLASDKLSNIKEPCLELDMGLQDGYDKRELCIEMSKQELKSFIDSLEAAHKVIVPMLT